MIPNSPQNPTRPGSPKDAMNPNIMNVAKIGALPARPPRRGISLVPKLCPAIPQVMKSIAVTSPCANIWKMANIIPISERHAIPSITIPMWLMDENATIFLRSFCAMQAYAP